MKFTRLRAEGFLSLLLFISLVLPLQARKKDITETQSFNAPAEYVELAQKHYNNRSFRKAIATYQKILDRWTPEKATYDKELAWACYEIGFCYLLMKKNNEASRYFEMVMNEYELLAARTLAQQRLEEIEKLKNRHKKK